jgi:hypothetical protein
MWEFTPMISSPKKNLGRCLAQLSRSEMQHHLRITITIFPSARKSIAPHGDA